MSNSFVHSFLRRSALWIIGLTLLIFLAVIHVTPVQAVCPLFPYTVAAGDTADLINAIVCANSNGIGTHDVINLTNSTYTLTAINNNATGLPPIANAGGAGTLTINGNGATITRSGVGGTPEFRLVYVDVGANLTLNRVTLSNGKISGVGNSGGGIFNSGTLLLNESTVSTSQATVGGGIVNATGASLVVLGSTILSNIADTNGGGISNRNGTLKIINSTMYGNYSAGADPAHDGGALETTLSVASVQIINSTIANNGAVQAARSGLWIDDGTVTIQNSIVTNVGTSVGNCAVTSGTFTDGGNNIDNGTSCGFGGATGQNTDPMLYAIANYGGFTMTMQPRPGSPAVNAGDNANAVNQSGGALTTDQRGTGFARIFGGIVDIGSYEWTCAMGFPHTVPAGNTTDLIDALACANANGAGTNDVIALTYSTYTLSAVNNGMNGLPAFESAAAAGTLTINGNGATIGRSSAGGTPEFRLVSVEVGGNVGLNRLTLRDGKISGAGVSGGALSNSGTLLLKESMIAGSQATLGGGIVNATSASLVILGSTIYGNTADINGGGITNRNGTLKIINSTISGNTANGAGGAEGGGGLYTSLSLPTVQIINSTIANNTAVQAARSGIWIASGTLTIQNSIVANNNGTNNCAVTGGVFTDGGNNLDNGTTCGFGGAVGQNTNPMLGALGDNGGPTLTHALGRTSPAINAGSNAKAVDQNGAALTTDQRSTGFTRISGAAVDVGAFELMPTLKVTLKLQGRSNAAPHPSYIVTVHVIMSPNGGGAPIFTQNFVSNESGIFFIPNLPQGLFQFSFKGTHTLAEVYNVTINAGENATSPDSLREGDASDNNGITIADFSILAATFGKTSGQAGYDGRADFNGDNGITIADFSLLASNFGQVGDGGVMP